MALYNKYSAVKKAVQGQCNLKLFKSCLHSAKSSPPHLCHDDTVYLFKGEVP